MWAPGGRGGLADRMGGAERLGERAWIGGGGGVFAVRSEAVELGKTRWPNGCKSGGKQSASVAALESDRRRWTSGLRVRRACALSMPSNRSGERTYRRAMNCPANIANNAIAGPAASVRRHKERFAHEGVRIVWTRAALP